MKLLASATAIRDVTIAKNTERIRGGSARRRGVRLLPSLAGLLVEPSGPIRRTHQRTGQHSGESQLLGVLRELCEFVGRQRQVEVVRQGIDERFIEHAQLGQTL